MSETTVAVRGWSDRLSRLSDRLREIAGSIGHVGLLDFHLAAECIEAGETAVYQAEPDIREALSMFELEPA